MFDFSCYSQDDLRQANLDFCEYMKDVALKVPLSVLPETEVRVQQVEAVTEDFYAHFGEHMNTVCLYYLSNYLLQDFIKKPKRNKTMNEADGFFTPQQLAERQRRELSYPVEVLDAIRINSLFQITRPKRTVNLDDV